ncbi:MAG TPA: hypothetical protein PLZ08_04190 [Bacillota bacterium]|nr:hypothetical protein [Bacillota bacterium]HOL09417.1 hypothetical protein [Bacillota bacterium]HPO97141.1 hypothetical protein [Bacillota bacterium]
MNRLLKPLLLVILMLFGQVVPAWALGVSDFVSVADSASGALYNPAGLVSLENKNFLIEYRFSGRDLAMGWDDLLIYSVAESRGTGALYVARSQDLIGIQLYSRYLTLGYSYGWQASENIALGVAAKFSNYGIYNKYTGSFVKEIDSKDFLLDFGLVAEVTDSFKVGLAIHNIGRDDSIQTLNYQSTVGCSYTFDNKLVIAAEIYDFLNEGKSGPNPIEGSLLRLGARVNIGEYLRIHAVAEEDLDDWDYSGRMFGVELDNQNISVGASWYQGEGSFIDDELIQVTINYKF